MSTRSYLILDVLGEGGFGKVYRAETAGALTRQVALKLLHAGLARGDEVARRLRDEARMLALLRHRAIVQVDSLIRVDGQWCAVMEYVKGTDLHRVMAASGAVPAAAALEIVAEVAGALHEAYTTVVADRPLCLIHRDIKPSNIVLTAAGEVKLLDFGVARAEFEEREAETQSISYGTLNYMAPERMLFETSPAGDIYALGVVLVELLLGRPAAHTVPNERRHQALVADLVREVVERTGSLAIGEFVDHLYAYNAATRPDARETQRHALLLARSSRGEPLRDWAERAVTSARRACPPAKDDLCGTTLVEKGRDGDGVDLYTRHPLTPGRVAPLNVPPPPPAASDPFRTPVTTSGWGTPAVAIAGILLFGGITLVSVGIGGWWWAGHLQEGSGGRTSPLDDTGAVSGKGSGAEPTKDSGETREEDSAKDSEEDPQPTPRPERKPRPPVVAPPPPPTPMGRVTVTGDAEFVEFVGDRGTFPPGNLPAGAYKVRGRFPGGVTRALGEVTVPVGGTASLNCGAAFERCVPLK